MLIHKLDNVEVNLENGHKYAITPIKKGEDVIKYGNPIGHATCDIGVGEHVHTHNLHTLLSGELEYEHRPTYPVIEPIESRVFMGYPRKDGRVG